MNGLPDIPRIYTALAEWLACLLYLLPMQRRLAGRAFALAAAGFLVFQAAFLQLTGGLATWLWVPCMVVAMGGMFLFVWQCGGAGAMDSCYLTVRAFVLAELMASCEWQIHCFLWPERVWSWQGICLIFTVYAVGFGLMAWLEWGRRWESEALEMTGGEVFSALVIGVAVFAMSNASFLAVHSPFTLPLEGYSWAIFNIRTMVDLGGVAILFAHHVMCRELRYRRELTAMEGVLRSQYLQYQQSKESVDLINRKYHDLKHIITALRTAPDAVLRERYLDELEADITSLEMQDKTGHPVLDTLLAGKRMVCQREGIALTCLVDGGLLEFVHVMDLCTIFGNALDNAIECQQKVAQRDKRMIHVTVKAQRQFALLRFENYCDQPLQLVHGQPVTTKSDRANHGLGLKSIRHTVGKYDGSVTLSSQGQWVELRILIPLPAPQ